MSDAAAKKSQADYAALQQTLKKAADENVQLKNQLADRQKQGDAQNDKLSVSEAVIKKSQADYLALQKSVNQTADENAQIKTQLTDLKKQSAEQNDKLSASEAANKKSQADYLALQKTLKQAADDAAQLKTQLADLQKKSADQSEKLAASEVTNKKSQSDYQISQAALSKSSEEVKRLTSQLTESQQAANNAAEEKSKLTAELEKTKKDLASNSIAAVTQSGGELLSDAELKTLQAKESKKTGRSYSVGYLLGQAANSKIEQVVSAGEKIDRNVIIKGFVDRMNELSSMSTNDMRESLNSLDTDIRSRQEKQKSSNEENNQKILNKAGKVKGAVKAKSGFIYLISKPGSQPKVTMDKSIRLQIVETLGDGKVIASEKDNNVISAAVTEIPAVLQEVVLKLGLQGEATIYIPPELAYGKDGIPGKIPPNSLSIMKIKILGVKDN